MFSVRPVWAHANLISSEPAANATLERGPEVIRLTFTEPLEPQFSGITLRDAEGSIVSTPPSEIDPEDPLVILLVPGDLPDGLYTVSWRSLSAADGHQAAGSFVFVVGAGTLLAGAADLAAGEAIPPLGAALRFFDLLSLSLLIGGVGFSVFQPRIPSAEGRMRRLIWIGWVLAGVSGLLLLPYQVSVATGVPLLDALPSLGALLTSTRFGQLWMIRMALWLVSGVALRRRWNWLVFGLGGLILITRSLNSHSSAMHDPLAMLLADWLHLLATVLWVGGLAQFANAAAFCAKICQCWRGWSAVFRIMLASVLQR